MHVQQRMRREVAVLDRPAHGGDGWRLGGVEDFSANLNPLGPPDGLQEVVRLAAADLAHYPDDSSAELKEALARKYGLGPENFIVGAGSSEIIRLFPEVFLERGDKVLMPRPTFMEYGFACRFMGASIVPLELKEGSFYMDVEVTLNAIGPGFKAVYLCTPNNPTGVATRRADVLRLARELEERGVLLFLDETLLELTPGETVLTCAREVRSHPNLLVIRSLTKSFAVPGLRCGYGIAHEDMVSCLERGRQTWNLGRLEQEVSTWLVRDCQGHVSKAVDILGRERDRVHAFLQRIGARTHRPDAFYFFLDVGPSGQDGASFRKGMLAHGVVVRDCASFGKPYDRYVRFCVKTPGKDEALMSAIRSVWQAGR